MATDTRKWLLACLPAILILCSAIYMEQEKSNLALYLVAAMIVLFLSIWWMSHHLREKQRVQEAQRLRRVLARQRHDWMNHVQVLQGYLMMNKSDESKKYLQKMIYRAMRDRRVSDLTYPPLAVFLLTIEQKFSQWRVYITLGESIEMSTKEQKHLLVVLEIFFHWLANVSRKHPEWTDLYLQIVTDDTGITTTVKRITEEGKLAAFAFSDHEWSECMQSLEPWQIECRQIQREKMYLQFYQARSR